MLITYDNYIMKIAFKNYIMKIYKFMKVTFENQIMKFICENIDLFFRQNLLDSLLGY